MKLKYYLLPLMLAMGNPLSAQSWSADNGNGTYTNPLFYDEFSDPDIIRVGSDYYLAGTTMHTVPGIVILHSKDLVNWEFASYCFNRFDTDKPEFRLENKQNIYGQGIWAPCIRYHKGKFYVFSNINGVGLQVYIADDIKGPWKHHKVEGDIYDLSVLFDDDGKIYAIHHYGNVQCTELKSDLSGVVEGSTRTIIPEGNAMGEGHHIYKINGWYYILSADYAPMGRMMCARSRNIFGPYETCVISARESFGYHSAWSTGNVGFGTPIPDDGFPYRQNRPNTSSLACATIHQGGIVQAEDGSWWGLSMQDFNAVGRTTCLSPLTWKDNWPFFGLEGNLGRSPKTWKKPNNSVAAPHAPYVRSDEFQSKSLSPIWQWNHNPVDKMWSLSERKGALRLHTLPADNMLAARNTLTQRAIGPQSTCKVFLDASRLKDGDEAGLGALNMPYASLGVRRQGGKLQLRWYDAVRNTEELVDLSSKQVWLSLWGDYDESKVRFAYSLDGNSYQAIGDTTIMSYQLRTFQGVRISLYAFNRKGVNGGAADFDHFSVDEPMADRSVNLPLSKKIRIRNLADRTALWAMPHGLLHFAFPGSREEKEAVFELIGAGEGRVLLRAADGRYAYMAGEGLSGDIRFTTDRNRAEPFLFQDMLRHEFMLLSLRNHRYLGKNPSDGSSYSLDFPGADANRRNGCVLKWELAE